MDTGQKETLRFEVQDCFATTYVASKGQNVVIIVDSEKLQEVLLKIVEAIGND